MTLLLTLEEDEFQLKLKQSLYGQFIRFTHAHKLPCFNQQRTDNNKPGLIN